MIESGCILAQAISQQPFTAEAVISVLWSWGVLAAAGAIAVMGIRLLDPRARGPWLPPQRMRAIPWSFTQIALLVLALVTWESIGLYFIGAQNRESRLVAGMAATMASELVKGTPGAAAGNSAAAAATVAAQEIEPPAAARRRVWTVAATRPLQLLTILFAIPFFGGRFYQVGLTGHRLGKDVISGYLLWLFSIPVVFAVYWLVLLFTTKDRHPLESLILAEPTWADQFLIVLLAVAAGPVVEELVFRGIIQPWMARSPEAADLTLLLSLTMAIVWGGTGSMRWPLLFLVTVGPGYLAFELATRRWLPRTGAARAIFSTSILFAAIHSGVWPTPIPLFVFSLGLGFLAYRTQSIIGPLVAHGLFNAVSVFQLLGK